MAKLFNRAWHDTATTGTGTITLGSARTGYATFAEAGVADGHVVSYTIIDGNDFEIGIGTYTSSGTTLARTTVTLSKISGTAGTSKINLSGSASVFISMRKEDIREVLQANRTYYVRTDGSDSNTGLANTAGGAFLTIQNAINTAVSLDLSIYAVTIQVAAGTYTGAVTLSAYVGVGPITITGDTTTPSNVVISVTGATAVTADDCGIWRIEGCKTTTTTSGHHLYIKGKGSSVTVGAWDYGTTGGTSYSQVFADSGATISLDTSYNVTGIGTSGRHLNASGPASTIQYNAAITVTGSASLAFGIFAVADRSSAILFNAVPTFSGFGSVTGQRYVVQNLSFMYTAGSGTSKFPGSTAGSGTDTSASPWGLYA